jgi:NADH-quinone oxidoreductase subunit L
MVVASIIALSVMAWAYVNYAKRGNLAKADEELTGWEKVSNAKLYFDELYNFLFVKPIEWLSNSIYHYFDIFILKNGIFRFAGLVEKTGNVTRKWQTGFLSSYLLWMVLGLVVIVGSYFINK